MPSTSIEMNSKESEYFTSENVAKPNATLPFFLNEGTVPQLKLNRSFSKVTNGGDYISIVPDLHGEKKDASELRTNHSSFDAGSEDCSDLFSTCLDKFSNSILLPNSNNEGGSSSANKRFDYSSLPLPLNINEPESTNGVDNMLFKSDPCINSENQSLSVFGLKRNAKELSEVPMEGVKESSEQDDLKNKETSPWDLVADLQKEITSLQQENSSLRLELYQSKLYCSELVGQMNCRNHFHEPGYVSEVIAELHAANRVRDQAMMARLKLANEERDAILKSYTNSLKRAKSSAEPPKDSAQRPLSSVSCSSDPPLLPFTPRLSTSLPPHIFAEAAAAQPPLNTQHKEDKVAKEATRPNIPLPVLSATSNNLLPDNVNQLPSGVPFFCVGSPRTVPSSAPSIAQNPHNESLKAAFDVYTKRKADRVSSSHPAPFNGEPSGGGSDSFSAHIDLPSRLQFTESVNLQQSSTPYALSHKSRIASSRSNQNITRSPASKQSVEMTSFSESDQDLSQNEGRVKVVSPPNGISSTESLTKGQGSEDDSSSQEEDQGIARSGSPPPSLDGDLSNGHSSMKSTSKNQNLLQQNSPSIQKLPQEISVKYSNVSQNILEKLDVVLHSHTPDAAYNCINDKGELSFDAGQRTADTTDSEDSKELTDVNCDYDSQSIESSEASSLFCFREVAEVPNCVERQPLPPAKPPRRASARDSHTESEQVESAPPAGERSTEEEEDSVDICLSEAANSKLLIDDGSSISPQRIIKEMTERGGGGVMIGEGEIEVCDTSGNKKSFNSVVDGDGKENVDINVCKVEVTTPKHKKKTGILSAIANLRGGRKAARSVGEGSDDGSSCGDQSTSSPLHSAGAPSFRPEDLTSTLSLHHKVGKKKKRKGSRRDSNCDTSNTSEESPGHKPLGGLSSPVNGFYHPNGHQFNSYGHQFNPNGNQFPYNPYMNIPRPLSNPYNTFQFNTSGLLNTPTHPIWTPLGYPTPNQTGHNPIVVNQETLSKLTHSEASVLPVRSQQNATNNNAAGANANYSHLQQTSSVPDVMTNYPDYSYNNIPHNQRVPNALYIPTTLNTQFNPSDMSLQNTGKVPTNYLPTPTVPNSVNIFQFNSKPSSSAANSATITNGSGEPSALDEGTAV